MTTLAEVMDLACSTAREVKDQFVATARGGRTDIKATILSFRGQELVAIVKPPQIDRDEMLAGVRMCAFGMGADLVGVVVDTFMATGAMKNPRTGEPWGPGEMQDAVEHHRGRETGLIVDALTVMACNRAGDIRLVTMPYRIRKGRVQWLPAPPIPDDADYDEIGGAVADFMRAVMTAPSLAQEISVTPEIAQVVAELGAERAQAHQDVAAARVLTENHFTVALCAQPDTIRAQVLAERAAAQFDGGNSRN